MIQQFNYISCFGLFKQIALMITRSMFTDEKPVSNFLIALASLECRPYLSIHRKPVVIRPFSSGCRRLAKVCGRRFSLPSDYSSVRLYACMHLLSGAYTQPHDHPFNELIIILCDDLLYEILLGYESFIVRGNHSIWIPAGLMHAANVISGTGYFVTLRLDDP